MFKKIIIGFRSFLLTQYYGFLLKNEKKDLNKKILRIDFASKILNLLNITVKYKNLDKLPQNGKFLILINHRSVIDPLIIELLFENSNIYGHWVAKKELYNSPFFGIFVRNAGTILVDREKSEMSSFFKDIRNTINNDKSVLMFPEGTRNKDNNLTLAEFKKGANIIALKNKINILPIFIEEKTDLIVKNFFDNNLKQNINVNIGDIILYNERNIEQKYIENFNLN